MTDNFAVFRGGKDDLHFDVTSTLVKRAPDNSPRGTDWKIASDQFLVTVTQREYGNTQTFDYWAGIGNRKVTHGRAYATPVMPKANSFLYSIASDVSTTLELPAETGAAMDHLADEMGAFDKPSDALRLVEGLRANVDKVKALLRNTGMTLQDFAEWQEELDA
jgi:hypothetical protein